VSESFEDLALYDYELPPELIAQEPAAQRDGSRLLVIDRRDGSVTHRRFRDVAEILETGDLLVVNDTRVIPARLRAHKDSGGAIEVLLVESDDATSEWTALWKPGKAFRQGATIHLDGAPGVTVVPLRRERELFVIAFERDGRRLTPSDTILLSEEVGETPLPPYIRRSKDEGRRPADRSRYQTIYASEPGAVAAPTAGLHFTEDLLQTIAAKGVERVAVTLHVGIDTFKPLSEEAVRTGELHGERVHIDRDTACRIEDARSCGRRIVAVGTTTARTLESFAAAGRPAPYDERTRLFIRPPYEFQQVDALITNFHLPRSSLLMMVGALVGREQLLEIYRDAVQRGYRFFSYGDAMMIV
jgi:S-adenosylmethionine:tRNA ribosyltransferase-isomerase